MRKLFKVILLQIFIFVPTVQFAYSDDKAIEPNVSYDEIYDPLEPVNRAILGFNFFNTFS